MSYLKRDDPRVVYGVLLAINMANIAVLMYYFSTL